MRGMEAFTPEQGPNVARSGASLGQDALRVFCGGSPVFGFGIHLRGAARKPLQWTPALPAAPRRSASVRVFHGGQSHRG